jgi:hypothetical protein
VVLFLRKMLFTSCTRRVLSRFFSAGHSKKGTSPSGSFRFH